VSSGGC